MKPKKLLLMALTVLCMTVILCTGCFAVDLDDERFAGKTWEEVMADFLSARGIDPAQVTAGYYNTVTGEEYYHNPETLMYGASVAKLPTNMLYAERVSKGEMTMDTLIRGNRYEMIQKLSLVNSDNPAMTTMVTDLGHGNYAEFRKQILPYIGETEETVDEAFLARNFFNPKQIIYTLKLLYGNEEKYPGVEACLLKASPYDYFKGNQPDVTIAHKYGWYTDRGTTYLNDSAIIYTDDPILLVMFTADVKDARYVLADFCSYMIDYAQYSRTQRFANDTAERMVLDLPTSYEFLSSDTPANIDADYAPWQFGFLAAGSVVLIIALILLLKKKLWTIPVLLLSAALIIVGGSPTELAHLAVRDNTARQVVAEFAEAFHTNTRGIPLLENCDSAMAHTDGTELPDRIAAKVSDSFTLTPGSAVRTGNCVAVSVTAEKTDIAAVKQQLEVRWQENFDKALSEADPAGFYDPEGNYNPELVDKALEEAVESVLADWDSFRYTVEDTLHLTLTVDGLSLKWKILCNDALMNLVNYE